NPSKCIILDISKRTASQYQSNGDIIQVGSSFSYLSISFRFGNYLHSNDLISTNTNKAIATKNQLSTIGVNHTDFSKLLPTSFYVHVFCFQLDYDLTTNKFTLYT
ncbi:MAG: hypothetical protein EXX96DRAFT_473631, partial [Benjaminiella poitrasii]